MNIFGVSLELLFTSLLLEGGALGVFGPHVADIGGILGRVITQGRHLLIQTLHCALNVVLLADAVDVGLQGLSVEECLIDCILNSLGSAIKFNAHVAPNTILISILSLKVLGDNSISQVFESSDDTALLKNSR